MKVPHFSDITNESKMRHIDLAKNYYGSTFINLVKITQDASLNQRALIAFSAVQFECTHAKIRATISHVQLKQTEMYFAATENP